MSIDGNTNQDLNFKIFTVNMSPAGLSGAQISKRAQDFCRLVIEATHPPIQWDLGSFPVIKRPEHDAEQ
jgi:hypothetical protein